MIAVLGIEERNKFVHTSGMSIIIKTSKHYAENDIIMMLLY